MARFTRTAYATGSLVAFAHEIANQAHLDKADLSEVYGDDLGRKSSHRRTRVKITVLVERVAAAPKATKPRAPRPVQQHLPEIEPPRSRVRGRIVQAEGPASPELTRALGSLLRGTRYDQH